MNLRSPIFLACCLLLAHAHADAQSTQDTSSTNHAHQHHSADSNHSTQAMQMDVHSHAMDHAAMDMHDDTASPSPNTAVPTPTEADIADAFPVLHAHAAHKPANTGYLLVDRLEAWDNDHGSGQSWELSGWYGGDIDRLWLRSEGERSDGHTESSDVEALYGHAISPWWDVLLGVRQDFRPDHGQTRAAIGIQGLAPYKFEIGATAYFGGESRSMLKLEAEYELLLTNRLILQPRAEAHIAWQDDPGRNTGSGLTSTEVGFRLRYEFTRRFAPYVGWVCERSHGDTARWAERDGERSHDSRFVAGVRFWF